MSVGVESLGDLKRDLDQALVAGRAASQAGELVR